MNWPFKKEVKKIEPVVEKPFDVMEYLAKNPLSEEQLLRLALDMLNPKLETFSAEEEASVIKDLSNVQALPEYLTALMNSDVKRHFKAMSPAEQINIRGAFGRTLLLRAKLVKQARGKRDVKIPKLSKRSDVAV